MTPAPSIALLLTGNELMTGDTLDSNSAAIATALADYHVGVAEKVTVGDHPERLLHSLDRLCREHAVIIMNGGLGPTDDDLTAAIIAQLVGVELVENPDARDHVVNWCSQRGFKATGANLKQALLPANCDLIHNPRGSALGFAVTHGGALILTTPGVPGELRAMLPEVCRRLRDHLGDTIVASQQYTLRLQTFGIGESAIQEIVKQHIRDWPEQVSLGFRSGLPQLELKLTVGDQRHLPLRDQCYQALVDTLGDHIIGDNDTTLAAALQTELRAQGKTVVTAESCTGGLIAAMITREAGASEVFHAGYISYANEVKHQLLNVPMALLEQHGAVSRPVVERMLQGALQRSAADMGVAVSGVAGPGGGTQDKPVGTVWIAWGSRNHCSADRFQIPGDRPIFQTLTAAAAIDLVRRQLLGLPPQPKLLTRFQQR